MKIRFCWKMQNHILEFAIFKRTGLWRFFHRSVDGKDSSAKCVYTDGGDGHGIECGAVLKMGKARSTGTLKRHLKAVHKQEANEEVGEEDGPSHAKTVCKESLECVVSRLVAKDGILMRVLTTSENLQRWAKMDNYNIPSSANIVRSLVLGRFLPSTIE